MIGFFKPAPHQERIKDPKVVKKNYRYWQFRTMYGMYFGYVLYYFTRKNITVAIPGVMAEFGYTMTDFGWILTLSSLMYGLSKFTSGIISDRSNPRYFMAVGLMLTGVLNIMFGMSGALPLLAILWSANGWFQGWGWPPCSRLLMHWYGRKQRARWWAVWNTSHNLGGAVIPILAAGTIAYFGGWRYALYIPGIMAIGGGFILMNRLRDTPQSLGLPPIEEFSGANATDATAASSEPERELTTREILFKYVLTNRYIWILSAAYFFVYFVRQAVNDWSFVYLTTQQGYSMAAAGVSIGLFEIGGLCGSLAAGWLSDLGFGGRRGPTSVIFGAGIILSVIAFWFFSGGHWFFAQSSMFAIGFFIFGPQMLIGIAAAELSHKKAAATATGFAGAIAYVGAATAGAPLASITESWGWSGFFTTIVAGSALVILLLVPLWSVTHREDTDIDDESTAEAA